MSERIKPPTVLTKSGDCSSELPVKLKTCCQRVACCCAQQDSVASKGLIKLSRTRWTKAHADLEGEGLAADQHHEQHHPEAEDVHGRLVGCIVHHLWGHKTRGPQRACGMTIHLYTEQVSRAGVAIHVPPRLHRSLQRMPVAIAGCLHGAVHHAAGTSMAWL
jgi:hypothetical protein